VERTELQAALDTGPILHLYELGESVLLSDFSRLLVAEAVAEEAAHLCPSWDADITAPIELGRADVTSIEPTIEAYSLHSGESEALALAKHHGPGCLLLTDDAAARLASQQLGLRVHGTIGVLLRALRLQRRSKAQVLQALDRIPVESTLSIRPSLLARIRVQVEEF
jgi:predicted nucleic acid-binding protein